MDILLFVSQMLEGVNFCLLERSPKKSVTDIPRPSSSGKGGCVGDDSKGNCRGARELDCCRRMGVDKAVTFFQN